MTNKKEAGSEALHFRVGEREPRERLDKLVVHLLASAGQPTSRAVVQRWIASGRVLVDGGPARASIATPIGAAVEVRPEAPPPSTATPDSSVTLPIVFEDEHLIVIDKPAGLVVHPARGHAVGTLVNGLLARPDFSRAPADPRDPMGHVRPGIVHRLDKGTSGLLVVAKDEPTREALKEQFAKHTIEREYVAIVIGSARDATYDTPHGRHPTDRLRFTSRIPERTSTRTTKGWRRAVTHVRVLEQLGAEATLVVCSLETGRTHQIRVHLAERGGTPILGDPLYGRPPRQQELRAIAELLGRQALHARVLGFVHPATNAQVRWESAVPADIQGALDQLRRRATKSSI